MKFCIADRKYILFITAAALFCLSAFLGLLCGSASITFSDMLNAVKNGAVGVGERVFLYVRLPRVSGCLVAGAALSVSGAVIQNVLANKLASPSIIGVNSGAFLAVAACAVFGIYGGWRLSLFSFLGAFLAVLLVSLGAKRWGASRSTVVLMGVALNSILGAVSDALITFNPDVGVMINSFKAGDFSSVTYQKLVPALVITVVSLAVLITLSNELEILTLGDENARGLGLDTRLTRTLFLLISALLAGCAVSMAGLVSFVGLLVPHAVRKLGVKQTKYLLPLCALFGAGFVALCDTLARTAFAPYEIPVGIIIAFIGAPFFVFLLIKGKGGKGNA